MTWHNHLVISHDSMDWLVQLDGSSATSLGFRLQLQTCRGWDGNKWLYVPVCHLGRGTREPETLSPCVLFIRLIWASLHSCWISRAEVPSVQAPCWSAVYIMLANTPFTEFSQPSPGLESVWERLHEVWLSRGVVHCGHQNKSATSRFQVPTVWKIPSYGHHSVSSNLLTSLPVKRAIGGFLWWVWSWCWAINWMFSFYQFSPQIIPYHFSYF